MGITLSDVRHTFPAASTKYLASLGQPVRLRLAGDAQPKTPVTLRFKIDQSKVSKATWSSPRTYAVLTQSAGSSTASLLPATYDAKTGELVAKSDHLSWFTPVQLVLSSFINNVGTTILHGLGVEYDSPDCDGKQLSTTIDDVRYSTSGAWAISPCLSEENGHLKLALYSTTGIPFKVTSTPNATATGNPGLSATAVGQQLAFDLLFSEKNANFVAPGGELDYVYTDTGTKTLSFLEQPAMLYVVTLIDFAESAIPEANSAAKAMTALDKLDCMTQIAKTAKAAGKLTTVLAGDITSAFIGCAGQVFSGVLWELATAGPSLLVNMGLGVVTTLAGQGSFTMTIKASQLAPLPVLGTAYAFPAPQDTDGFGHVRPSDIFQGGDPTGSVTDISWASWGGASARGTGTSCYVPNGRSVSECIKEPVDVLASNLGVCSGKAAYEDLTWWFPNEGETFNGWEVENCQYADLPISNASPSSIPVLADTDQGSGFGSARPSKVDWVGAVCGTISGITWDNWGSATSIGHGTACPGSSTAQEVQIVATNLGTCNGETAYENVDWYTGTTKPTQHEPYIVTCISG